MPYKEVGTAHVSAPLSASVKISWLQLTKCLVFTKH